MAFKQATVNASDVPATLTDYPSYIDWSRTGITTLAEAQSVRVYADSGKVVEWAREVMSSTEGHTKVPSLTSSTSVYVDYDGVRADYAVTDTYGRNAVWSDYVSVFHMEDASTSITDSTGASSLSETGSPTYSVASQIENGITYTAQGQYHRKTSGGSTPAVPVTLQCWFNVPDTSTRSLVYMGQSNSEHGLLVNSSQLWALSQISGNAQAVSGSISTGTWYMGHGVFSATTLRTVYLNGSSAGTNTTSRNPTSGTGVGVGTRFSTTGQDMNGTLDEVRVRKSALSANWISTEYNNQSDEPGFWGTWTTIGGGGGYRYVPQLTPFAGL